MAVTREKLFEEIWAEPMTTVAARYNVSSTYLARICKRLKVPLPGRGHWAQVAVGKGVSRPALPKARVGDELEWSKGHEPRTQLPLQPPDTNGKERRRRFPRAASHHLVFGAQAHLEAGVDSYSSYLKPSKRKLVDVLTSQTALDRALEIANQLFLTLESFEHHVVFSTARERHRLELNLNGSGWGHWHPDRPTVVFVGTVEIGLTLYEMTEEAEVSWVDGKYVRVAPASKRQTYSVSPHRKTQMPSGRFALRAYSPYYGANWEKLWQEQKVGEFSARRFEGVAKELEAAAAAITQLVAERDRQQEIQRQKWGAERVQWQRQEEERLVREAEQRREQAQKDSFNQLVSIIGDWAFARQMETFFKTALEDAASLGEEERGGLLERLERARRMFGGIDPLPHCIRSTRHVVTGRPRGIT